MKTVITYGTFDLFHVGHVNLLARLRKLGDRLIVGCSTDEFNSEKGKKTIYPFQQRVQILSAIRFVDSVIAEESWDQKRADIVREGVRVFAMGDDWAGRFDDLADVCDVIYIPRTSDISTTEVRQLVNALHSNKVSELSLQVERLAYLVSTL